MQVTRLWWHDSLNGFHVTWLIHMFDKTHSHVGRDWWILRCRHCCCTCGSTDLYVGHDSYICVMWLIHACDLTDGSFDTATTAACVTRHIHRRDTTLPYVWRDWFIYVTWLKDLSEWQLLHEWSISFICGTRSLPHVWRDSFICGSWLINIGFKTRLYVVRDSFLPEMWLMRLSRWLLLLHVGRYPFHMWDSIYWYVERDSFICVTWLIHTCHMTHSWVGRGSFIRVIWLIHTGVMTHSYRGRDSFIQGTWLIHTGVMTHSYRGHDSFIQGTWLVYT